MDRLFKTRTFNRWCATELTDQSLCNAVNEMKRGLIDARLGGDVFKKRIAIPGRGKRAGARTLIASHLKDRWFFIFGFNKNERDNISPHELKYLQQLAQDLLAMNDLELKKVLRTGELLEIHYEEAQ